MVSASAIIAAIALLALGGQPAFAVTPESAEVKQVIERGLKFLETSQDGRLGGKCLIGLAFLKNGRDRSHAKIVEALNACNEFARAPFTANTNSVSVDNYSVGLAIIFLCEYDPVANRAAAQQILNNLLSRQMANGAWSYTGNPNGDTSQTQYAALGLWMADASGLDVPQASVEQLCGWLLRTQDPSGAFGYHPVDPGNMTRMPQSELRPSLVAAGLGSVYIVADLLGITDKKEHENNSEIPPVLKEVEQKQGKTKRRVGASKVIDADAVRRSMADGNAWFAKNFTVKPEQWTYYYHYGLERYMSFRELAENHAEREPDWYNQVFNYLRQSQQSSGGWTGVGDSDATSTSFAVLCLSRSTRKSINVRLKALGEGVLLGGMGLPKNISDLQERNGKVVESPLGGSVEEILAIIEDPNNPELKRLAESGQSIALDNDITKRSGQVARLRSLVAAGNYESRLVAIKSLAKVRDLDNVPVLLFGLTDPDVRIVLEADKALRFVSRKFRGVGLPADPQPPGSDPQVPAGQWPQVKAAQKAWKDWYLSIRPDAELLD